MVSLTIFWFLPRVALLMGLAGTGPAGAALMPPAAARVLGQFPAFARPAAPPVVLVAMQEPAAPTPTPAPDPTAAARRRMVERHLVEQGITDERVLDAFRAVPRHRFMPENVRRYAYEDESIPIGEGQTITAPYDQAFMSQVLELKPTDRVFEVGTGSGYQAAILSKLVAEVYTVEIHKPLGERAAAVLKELGYDNVHVRVGDGYAGWPEAAPFDAVIVTCAPEAVPAPLVEQLREGGRLVIPLGERYRQALFLYTKADGKLDAGQKLQPTLFVPMTGRAQEEAAKARTRAGGSDK